MNIDSTTALVPLDVIVAAVSRDFPNFTRYATTHSAYTTTKICHRETQRVREYLIKRGYITSQGGIHS